MDQFQKKSDKMLSHSRIMLTKEGAAPEFFRPLNFLDGTIHRNTQSKQQADLE